jgi:hypothetical protein
VLVGDHPISQLNDESSIALGTCTSAAVINAIDSVVDWAYVWRIVGKLLGKSEHLIWDSAEEAIARMLRGKYGEPFKEALLKANIIGRDTTVYLQPAASLLMARAIGLPIRFYSASGLKEVHIRNLVEKGYAAIGIVTYTASGTRHAVCINGIAYDTKTEEIKALHIVDSAFDVYGLAPIDNRLVRTTISASKGWITMPACRDIWVDDNNNHRGLANSTIYVVGHAYYTDPFKNRTVTLVDTVPQLDVDYKILTDELEGLAKNIEIELKLDPFKETIK